MALQYMAKHKTETTDLLTALNYKKRFEAKNKGQELQVGIFIPLDQLPEVMEELNQAFEGNFDEIGQ